MKHLLILAFISAVCILGVPNAEAETGVTSELTSVATIQQLDRVLSGVEAFLGANNIIYSAPIIQARRLEIKKQLRAVKGQKVLSISLAGQASVLHSSKPTINWEFSPSIKDVPLYALYTSADLGAYPNNEMPYDPSNPNPPDAATDVAPDVVLSWTGGDPDAGDIVTYDVYFDTMNPPTNMVASDILDLEYNPGMLEFGTSYFWQIISKDNFGGVTDGAVWQFTTRVNYPPNEPINPSPGDQAVEVDVNADLSWQCNDPNPGDTLTYTVYFGTETNPPEVANGLTAANYVLPTLELGTTYYWKILATDNYGESTPGAIWHFTTMTEATNNPPYAPVNPSPANGATDQDINVDLSWDGGDPDPGDTVTYDIFFGTSDTPPQVESNWNGSTYDPGTLAEGMTYYWYIVARDSHQSTTPGSTWMFATIQAPTPTPPVNTPTPYATYTPKPTYTPVPPSATPTNTPEITKFGVTLDMGGINYFCPGTQFYLNAELMNPESTDVAHPLFIFLDIENNYWFAPTWSQDGDFYNEPIPSGKSTKIILDGFDWPDISDEVSNINFWAAITNDEITDILGDYDMKTWGFGSCK